MLTIIISCQQPSFVCLQIVFLTLKISRRAEVGVSCMAGGYPAPQGSSPTSAWLLRNGLSSLDLTCTLGRVGLMTFSTHGGKNEFLSAGPTNLLKCKEREGEEQQGSWLHLITQNEQSRWPADWTQGPILHAEGGMSCAWKLLCCDRTQLKWMNKC